MSIPKEVQSPCRISILIVCDDHTEAARLRGGLARAQEIALAAAVPSFEEAFAELRRKPYDAMLLHLDARGEPAMDMLLRARSIAHRIATLVLSAPLEIELVLRSIEGGVQDFLLMGQTGMEALTRALLYATARHRMLSDLLRSRQATQSERDPLTGLLNRKAFERKLQETLLFGERFGDRPVVLLIDLNRFLSNERLGLVLKGRLMQELARRLTWCVRRSDLCGRLGRDTLAIALPHLTDGGAVEAVADRIRSALAEPFEMGAWAPRVTPSIGAARYPEDGRTARDLLRRAEAEVVKDAIRNASCDSTGQVPVRSAAADLE